MMDHAVFIAATGQNVGKTTICLGLNAALRKRYKTVGFIKPVGQQHVNIDGVNVDKDVVLFKETFDISSQWEDMSPVIIPSGFTRQFLDGEISEKILIEKVLKSSDKILSSNDFTLVEGTGHIGVGGIINMSNAKIASLLNLDVVIIAGGGLGSAFDELLLNISLCKEYNVKIRGVILNKVFNEKKDMIKKYFQKALDKLDVPLIGLIPFEPFLSKPTIDDFASLFNTSLLSGTEHRWRHFENVRLMAGSCKTYLEEMLPNELIITPASREDIILATLSRHKQQDEKNQDWQGGMILTGRHPPTDHIITQIKNADVPILYAPLCSYEAMKIITSFISKIRKEDVEKIDRAIHLVEENVDLKQICDRSFSQNVVYEGGKLSHSHPE